MNSNTVGTACLTDGRGYGPLLTLTGPTSDSKDMAARLQESLWRYDPQIEHDPWREPNPTIMYLRFRIVPSRRALDTIICEIERLTRIFEYEFC